MEKTISSYIDAILVEETKDTTEEVISQLNKFRLTAKQPEPLDVRSTLTFELMNDETRKLVFRRLNEIPNVKDDLQRRELTG